MLAQVGQFYFGDVGQYYFGANTHIGYLAVAPLAEKKFGRGDRYSAPWDS